MHDLGPSTPELLDALIASIADGLYLVDPDGLVRFMNPAGLALLGYDGPDELVGRPSHDTFHAHRRDGTPYPESECPLLRPRLTGETVHVDEDWFIRRDGTLLPVASSSAPVPTDRGRGAVVVFRDVRERMRGEESRLRAEAERVRGVELAASRRRLVQAADDQRRRLGRDLHDGAQQRLVNVVMALGLAGRELPPDAAGREMVVGALDEAKAAIDELRELAAGLHPAILSNRGLAAALESLTARAPLPVTLDVDRGRLPPSVEAAGYFVAAEALTNIAKHAEAVEAHVTLRRTDDAVTLEIGDDGRGGARLGDGTGLGGLRDRVAALGGTLDVISPPGEGTVLRAVLPLDRP